MGRVHSGRTSGHGMTTGVGCGALFSVLELHLGGSSHADEHVDCLVYTGRSELLFVSVNMGQRY